MFSMAEYKKELDEIVASVAPNSEAARRLTEEDY